MKIATTNALIASGTKGLVTLGLISALAVLAACGPQVTTTTTEQTTTRQVVPTVVPVTSTTVTTTQRTTP